MLSKKQCFKSKKDKISFLGVCMRYFLIFALLLVFFGCNAKYENRKSSLNKAQEQALINTRKKEFTKKGKRFLFLVTYLNPIKQANIDNAYETFLINLYASKEYKFLSSIDAISLNGKSKGIISHGVDRFSSLAKFSPSYNKWGRYFLIKAPYQGVKNLKLIIEIEDLSFELDFLKDMLK